MYTIYIHVNKINGKVYIGQTCQKPKYRWKRNGKGYETCEVMWKAIQKYGWDNFEHYILKENLTLEEANFYEQYYIKKYNSTNKKYGYNISLGGKNTPLKESTKKKLSEIFSGTNHPFYGRKHSNDTKRLISETKSLPVIQYDLQMNFIAKYKSAEVACKILNFKDKTCINKCCLKQRRTAHGFIWRYEGGNLYGNHT